MSKLQLAFYRNTIVLTRPLFFAPFVAFCHRIPNAARSDCVRRPIRLRSPSYMSYVLLCYIADFQFFGSILPCCNVVDWLDTYLKFSIFKCLSFKHSQNQVLDNKGGKSLVLLPVLVFANVQQSAKQNLTPNFRKPSRLRSKPFAITTFGVQW